MTPIRRLVVMWAEFGPYHVARLRAVHERAEREGAALVALETVGDPARASLAGVPWRNETLLPGRAYDAIAAAAMERAVRRALDRLRPDAVAITSYATPDSRAALAWCRQNRKTAVMMFDSRREDAPRSRWREAVKRTLVEQFDAALVAGTPHVAYAVELGLPREAVFTPFDVVDNVHFAAGADATRAATGPGRGFLTVARLAPVKGLDGLLAAYGRYREGTADPWPLTLVGDGSERAALERLAPEGVTFAGHVGYEALPEVYGRAGAFVLPSLKDTWGLVVNEAMAAGLPVLVSDGAGCAVDLVDEGQNGYRVPAGDVATLADRLRQTAALGDEPRHRMGEASRQIVARYRPEDFADGLWAAVQAGRRRADRPLGRQAAVVLRLLRALSGRTRSFQSIAD